MGYGGSDGGVGEDVELDGFDTGGLDDFEFGEVSRGCEDAPAGFVEGDGEGRAAAAVGAAGDQDGSFWGGHVNGLAIERPERRRETGRSTGSQLYSCSALGSY